MQKLLIGVFVATCGMFVMGACTPTETGDAGVEDAGEGGEGEGEGEGEQPGAESDSCNPTDADSCETGLICLPSALSATIGTCRVDCSTDAEACPSGRTCQDVISVSAQPLGTACIPAQSTRDGNCQAWSDPEACADDMSCLLTSNDEDAAGNPLLGFNCKVTCDRNADDPDAQCASGESCVMPSTGLFQNFQPDPANAQEILGCTIANCEEGGTGCECDATLGFECFATTASEEGEGICASIPGQCSTLVDPLLPEHVVPGGITADLICNEVDGHAACDQAPVGDEGASICITGISDNENEGVCFPLCSSPTADFNDDGTIAADEQGETFGCAEDWTCALDTGLALGIGATIADSTVPGGAKLCTPSACTEGEPCPSECGDGDYQCVTFGSGATAESLCFAPYGACVPEDVEPTDAGPEADAGVDAGGDTPDAGGEEPDAGAEDGGVSDAN